jgi:hypothetical protein
VTPTASDQKIDRSIASGTMVAGKRVLIISTSHEKLGDTNEKTGLW